MISKSLPKLKEVSCITGQPKFKTGFEIRLLKLWIMKGSYGWTKVELNVS